MAEEQKKKKNLTKKGFNKLKEVETFYKIIHKYKLREEAHKSLLKIYIEAKVPK